MYKHVQTRWERLSIVEEQFLQEEQELQEVETLDKDPACWGSSGLDSWDTLMKGILT